MNLLYIDPGTGSMLFSVLIGAAAALFFAVKAIWLKLKVFLSGKKTGVQTDNSFNRFVIYCEGKQYWNLFRPIIEEFENRKLEIAYYTSAKDDPVFNQDYNYVKPKFIGEGNAAFAKLNMLSADIVLTSTPSLNIYQWKRSKNVGHYCHILHATTGPEFYRLFGLDFFDSVLLTGDYQKDPIRQLEKQRNLKEKELVTVGCPYLDEALKRIAAMEKENDHPFTVLVSPSWGKNSLLSLYGQKLLDPLVQTGWRIIIRPHPQSRISEPEILDNLTNLYHDKDNIEWDFNRDNIPTMNKSDIMISDFSGIIYDYTFLFGKPVIYVNQEMDFITYDSWDLENHGKDSWQFEVLRKFGIELDPNNFENIKEIIQKASDSLELKEQREKAKNEGWMNIGNSAKLTVDYLERTARSN